MKDQAALEPLWLLYDGDCPICKTYCTRVRLMEAAGRLELVDARQPGPLLDEVTALGLDIDKGVVVKFRDVVYYGKDAVYMLALMSTRSGLFNRLSFLFFGSRLGAKIFYPVVRGVRDVILKLYGIGYIENLKRRV